MQRQSGGRGQNPVPPSASQRQNEYFVPRDGIDREVITADICRYLGNDALVRPGVFEDNGRSIPGYFITAYRNLTTAMIADLKADSARWDQERRKHHPGGVRYEPSQYRDVRQPGYSSGGSRDHYDAPRYPGSDAPGYSGGVGSAPASHNQYGGQSGFGQSAQYPPQQAGFTQLQPDHRYGTGGSGGFPAGYSQPMPDAPYSVGSNYTVNANEAYSRDTRMDTSGSGRPGYSSGQQVAYPPSSGPAGFGYQQAQAPGAAFAQPQQVEPFYGRGGYSATNPPTTQAASDFLVSPAGNSNTVGFSPAPDSQYGETPNSRSTASPSASAQAQTGNSGSNRRERERERDDRPADKHARHHYSGNRR